MRTSARFVFLRAMVVAGLTLASPVAGVASPIALSTFDSVLDLPFADGWKVGDLYVLTGSPSAPTFVDTGGAPGTGYIATTDLFGWNAFQAPANFIGNMIGAYGGSLSFYSSAATADAGIWPLVTISNGINTLQYETVAPTPGWTFFDVPLTAGPGWRVGSGPGSGLQPTAAQMQAVLSNLLFLHISADWSSGQDLVGLDTVMLCGPGDCTSLDEGMAPVPEPSTWLLATTGLAAVWLRRRAAPTHPPQQ